MTGLFDDNSVDVFVSVELHLLAWREGEVDVDLRPDENENERERDATEKVTHTLRIHRRSPS